MPTLELVAAANSSTALALSHRVTSGAIDEWRAVQLASFALDALVSPPCASLGRVSLALR